MKQFIAFVTKEFYHITRDYRTMLILLVMPVVQIILFGFALSNEVRNVNLTLLLPDRDAITTRIIHRLDASPYFTVTGIIDTDRDIDPAFQSGNTDMVLTFSPRFADRIFTPEGAALQLITDGTNPNIATASAMYASAIIRQTLADASSSAITAPPGITPNIHMMYNPRMKSSYTFVPGVMGLIIILICAMMTSIAIVREKENGTMELLLVSPTHPTTIYISKMIPYLIISLINYLTIIILTVTLLDMPIAGSFGTLTLLSLIYIIVALTLGLFISTIMTTQIAAMLASGMMLMIPMMFLSGFMFPTENMPLFFQYASYIIPAKWYIIGVKKIMIQGLPIGSLVSELSILCGMATLMMAISIRKFKNRL